MKKISTVFALFLVMFCITSVQARDLAPEHKLGNLYCYSGWTGNSSAEGHVILTNKPLNRERVIDEASSGYSFKKGTKLVGIVLDDDSKGKPTWYVRHNSSAFYKKEKQTAVECLKKVAGAVVKEHPVDPKKLKEQKRNLYRYY